VQKIELASLYTTVIAVLDWTYTNRAV